uniref:Candidate secreted effector n=1 Tax=Meloidogyne incognita TaxID=6306 RepID=A0A914NF34_MELIC
MFYQIIALIRLEFLIFLKLNIKNSTYLIPNFFHFFQFIFKNFLFKIKILFFFLKKFCLKVDEIILKFYQIIALV